MDERFVMGHRVLNDMPPALIDDEGSGDEWDVDLAALGFTHATPAAVGCESQARLIPTNNEPNNKGPTKHGLILIL